MSGRQIQTSATAEDIQEWDEHNDEPHPVFSVDHRPERVNLNEPERILVDNLPSYEIDGDLYVISHEQLWRRTGTTQNPRIMALADAIGSSDGELLTVHIQDETIVLQHQIAGTKKQLRADEQTPWEHPTFKRVEQAD